MAAVAEPLLMTVAQFRALPHRENVQHELHEGQLIEVTRPKMKHARWQSRLAHLLRSRCEGIGVVEIEVAFRALPEYDLRAADVAFVSRGRWDAVDDDDNLRGSPELVIEVLSPSNTPLEMREKAALCLATGAKAFWIADPDSCTITVMERESSPKVYGSGTQVPLGVTEGSLPVADVFRR